MKDKQLFLLSTALLWVFLSTDGYAKEGQAVLTVEKGGVIGENDPCPARRAKKTYSTLQRALDCARNGDNIRVLKGIFNNVDEWNKNVRIVGRGQSKTYINGNSDVSARVTLKRLTISSSEEAADGGILETFGGARLRLEDAVLTGGMAGSGGAMKINFGSRAVVKNSVLTANEADLGGAIENEGFLLVESSVIAGNKASTAAGIYNRGGTLSVSSSLITRNDALSPGEGIFNDGGRVKLRNNPIITLNTPTNCAGLETTVAIGLVSDANTLLLLSFENNLNGVDGEAPSSSVGVSYESGVIGQGAYLAPGNQVFFESAGNIDPSAGTLEFWIKPRWNGDDGQNNYALSFGERGGILIGKDVGGFWRIITNRFGSSGLPERGTGVFITDWNAGDWHHAAFTWNDTTVKVYVDGVLRAENSVGFALPPISDAVFQLGGDGLKSHLDAEIDELRLSDRERSAEEIWSSYRMDWSESTNGCV